MRMAYLNIIAPRSHDAQERWNWGFFSFDTLEVWFMSIARCQWNG